MKIKTKITSIFLTAVLSVVLLGGIFSYIVIERLISQDVKNSLNVVANLQYNRINEAVDKNIERLKGVSSRTKLRNTLRTYNEKNDPEDRLVMRNILADAKESIVDFQDIFVIGKDGVVAVSTDISYEGEDYSSHVLFKIGMEKEHLHFDRNVDNGTVLYLYGPMMLDGEFLGVVVIISNIETITTISADFTGLGDTGETVVAKRDENGDAEFLNIGRFENDKNNYIVKKDRTDVPITQALLKKDIFFDNVVDYREERVWSVTRYIESVDWGLVVKMDERELRQSIINFRNSLVIIIAVLSILIIIISKYVSYFISKPISKLRDGVGIIKEGNLDYKIGKVSDDEVGELSLEFDNMTSSIKESYSEVENKVAEQTEKIMQKQKQSDDQRKAILNILEDVEEEKQNVEREKEKIDAILHSIGDGVFVVDENLTMIMCNQVTADVSGYDCSEMEGQRYDKYLKFIFEESKEVNDIFINKAISTGEVQEMSNHTLLVRKDGTTVPVADSASPLKDDNGRVVGCVVVFRDVSKEYAIDKAKTEFVSLASHQLRTPLSTINWYTEMLLNGDAGKLKPEQAKYLEEIYRGNQRMVELVNALLNVSRLELGTFVVEPKMVDIKKIADRAIDELSHKIDQKKIKFSKKYGKSIGKMKLDEKLAMIIFQNLLSNAVKYTPEKGRVSLEIKKNKKDIEIIMSDTGMGIPKSQQKNIFTKLFRADNVRESDTEGTGLGLYIIKQIADHSGGQVSFVSQENKGTTFSLRIPLVGMKKKEGTRELDQTH